MHGMMGDEKKKMMRKKALESMMSEGPGIAIQIKKKIAPMGMESEEEAPMDKMSMMEGEQEEQMGDEKSGFESMMVSPEEKKMLMVLRKKGKMGSGDDEMGMG